MLTAGLLTGLFFMLKHFGYGIVGTSAAALISYIPLLVILVALWWILEWVF